MPRVIVHARQPMGYRKLGKLWPCEDTEAEVTDAELAVLKESPALVVVLLPEGSKNVSARLGSVAAEPEAAEYVMPEDEAPVRKKRGKG